MATDERSTVRLVESTYETLRDDIIRGRLRPNEPLVEADIAERLGRSRTPVREALQRLAIDGLIVSRRRRWFVYEHTRAEVIELYELRAALEGYMAGLAAVRATPEQLSVMRQWHDECAEAITDPPGSATDRWITANQAFHDAVNIASGNTQARNLVRKSWLYHFNTRVANVYTHEERRASSRQHSGILIAIENEDPDQANAAARKHVEYSLKRVLKVLPAASGPL